MKRLLTLLTCLLLLTLPALAEDTASYVGTWIETEGEGTLTIRLDGSATRVYDNSWVMNTTWAPADLPDSAAQEYLNRKFRCTTYTAAGYTLDAASLGVEYTLFFHDNDTVDFTMAGMALPNLPYSVTDEGVWAINYYGTMFNCTPTDAGFDMDFYGTMTMHFTPAE